MRRLATIAALLAFTLAGAGAGALALAPAAGAAPLDSAVARELARAGGLSGGYVLDTTTGRPLASVRADTPRIPASVEKLYTGATALLRFGADGTLDTRVLGDGTLDDAGTWHGDLFLRGAGDPTFGSASFTQRAYGTGATTAELAAGVREAGVRRVTGRVYGDETWFDRLRGGPSTNYGLDVYVGGPLSGLPFNRGLAKEDGSALQRKPAAFAAQQLVAELRKRRVRVAAQVGERATPAGAEELAAVSSPPMSTLLQLTFLPSDNYLAEMLLKDVGAKYGAAGSTAAGASVVRRTLARFSIAPRVADGSGLSRANATSPQQVVALLDGMRDQAGFRSSLGVAGRSGTLAERMRGSSAQDRCQGKTGTLSNVSALAGYCRTANDHLVAFAFMQNSVVPSSARAAQDRLAIMLARQRPAGGIVRLQPTVRSTPTPSRTRTAAQPAPEPATGKAGGAGAPR
jgi:D-alanyl-D-alanine carboxypeptidase/D-alanyl-D-alanine-endopeptidase (penicillin-binding protein 4)